MVKSVVIFKKKIDHLLITYYLYYFSLNRVDQELNGKQDEPKNEQ